MHQAYNFQPLTTNQPHQIEAITTYGNAILLGTRQGHLFMYNVLKNNDTYETELMRCNKTFSKKPVQQLEAIIPCNILISLTDNLIQVHDLTAINFPILYQIQQSKGATLFTTHSKEHTSLTGDTSLLIRLAVSVKRKLQMYFYKNEEFLPLSDINLTDIPKSMVWCEETICLGYRGEYALFKLDTGTMSELFPTSSTRNSEPCITKVTNNSYALCRDAQTVVVNTLGQPEKFKALKWSDTPSHLLWDEPYVIGCLPNCTEIQSIEPVSFQGALQTFPDLVKIRNLNRATNGCIYIHSQSQIWILYPQKIAEQRTVLLEAKEFQLALKLTILSDEDADEKQKRIHQIQTLLAYDLFSNHQYHESMQEFLKLHTDPHDVIRLFPALLPQAQDYDEDYNEDGLFALIEYLTEIRHQTNNQNQQLLQIIDTTLLKCYLHTNDALVAPLLRLNHCHLGESERILKKMGKINDLIILYQTKGQHRRALMLLKNEHSIDRTIVYLQHLGTENLGLILEFSDWVLQTQPEDGLKIFTDDVSDVELLPRPRIMDFLSENHKELLISYLEHILYVWEDKNPIFHNNLIQQYQQKALQTANSSSASQQHNHTKLIEFLKRSKYYNAELVLANLPSDQLMEERALVLGRLNRHQHALTIFIKGLGDHDKALDYCEKIYTDSDKTVYSALIKLLINPERNPLTLAGVTLPAKYNNNQVDTMEFLLNVLEKYANRIDALEILEILPESIPASRLYKFLQITIRQVSQNCRQSELLKSLLHAEYLQHQELKLHLQNQRIVITEMNLCPVCKKRFGNQSALIRYPNGNVVHFSCYERQQ